MKILVLTPGVFDKGGIARYGRFQIRALRESFGEPAVRVLSMLGRQIDDLEEPFHVDWSGPLPLTRVSRLYFAAAAARQALSFRPDVVLTQHQNLGPAAWPLARLTGARLVQNTYGLEVWSEKSASRRWVMGRSDLVICDSHHSGNVAKEIGLVRKEPVVVWDCVDLETYAPGPPEEDALASYGIPRRSRFRLLFLGPVHAWTRYKGTERCISLVAKLPADEFEAVIAGKGNDIGHLRRFAEELGVGDRVYFPGAIHEADLPHLYRSAGAFYLTSETGPHKGEGLPLTPLESMACGVPVIVGNQDGSREIPGVATQPAAERSRPSVFTSSRRR
jgi:phosphatidylinositol alpha-1,6-mannosyltransferase